jgi:hypothetical protein
MIQHHLGEAGEVFSSDPVLHNLVLLHLAGTYAHLVQALVRPPILATEEPTFAPLDYRILTNLDAAPSYRSAMWS